VLARILDEETRGIRKGKFIFQEPVKNANLPFFFNGNG
jgi:hypothetical protein